MSKRKVAAIEAREAQRIWGKFNAKVTGISALQRGMTSVFKPN